VPNEEYLVLSTIHSAKGQEWKNVTILSAVEGCIPSPMATRTPEQIEEERRLLHVAMTRTRDELDLVLPQGLYGNRQTQDDQHAYGSISRFLPRSVRGAFEGRTSQQPSDKSAAAVTSKGVPVEV
jgi:ATP-dependent DNA helicase UvrD/PcrA